MSVVTDTTSVDDDAQLAPLDITPQSTDGESALVPDLSITQHDLLHDGHHSSGNFPGIADYAFLSDCETNCLIAPSGAVEWMCIPRPDSPSVFTALLDRGAGSFRVGAVRREGAGRPPVPARARWCWRRPGRPRPAGWSSGTR